MYNIVLNTKTIPHLWKRTTIIPILKPYKDHNIGTNYRPMSLVSRIAKAIEKTHDIKHLFWSFFINMDSNITTQHTHCFDNICHQITKGFNNPRPPQRTVAVALDKSKAFDTVTIHQLILRLTLKNIPTIIIKRQ